MAKAKRSLTQAAKLGASISERTAMGKSYGRGNLFVLDKGYPFFSSWLLSWK